MSDPKKALDYLDSWLERFQKASDAVPYVQKSRDILRWQCHAISQQPPGTEAYPLYNPSSGFSMSYGDIPGYLPMIPKVDLNNATLVNTIAASGASGTYAKIIEMAEVPGKIIYEFCHSQTSSYQDIQNAQNKTEEVKSLVSALCSPNTLTQYDRASKAYLQAKSGVLETTTAALEIRTLVDNVQGDLFEKARNIPNENMTWTKMVNIKCPSNLMPVQHSELNKQGMIRGQIIDYLSTIMKRREGILQFNISDIWAMVLDHLYIVLNIFK